jgi:anti-sigma28 factor (negative regulator of flagellin synthesis)
MKVNDPNVSSLASTGALRSQGAAPSGQTRLGDNASTSGQSGDDIHLSELVRSLRALAPDSPQRQEHLEQIARSYASGTYKVDTHATAAKIVDDALQS